jgi:hypothetical protein
MRLVSSLLAVLTLAPLGAFGQSAPVVLELFTSQGCSSCPPADALLTELAGQEGVIALGLHVDYWDYLGWKDSFARPEHTARQRAYAKAARNRSIFTPEVIVQGEERVKGHNAKHILDEIARQRALPSQAGLDLRREGDALVIRVEPRDGGASGPAEVHVVRYIPSQDVMIGGGENAGRELTYTNIVTDWDTVGRWDGTAAAEFRAEGLAVGEPVAVIVQRSHMGPVITAAALQ